MITQRSLRPTEHHKMPPESLNEVYNYGKENWTPDINEICCGTLGHTAELSEASMLRADRRRRVTSLSEQYGAGALPNKGVIRARRTVAHADNHGTFEGNLKFLAALHGMTINMGS